MTRKLSPEKLEARKGRRIAHTKRDIWPLGMESDELISDEQLDAAFAELGAKRLPGLERRETVEALALRVVCRIPMSTGHRNLLLKLDLLLESRLEVYQLVLKQKGIRLVQAMSRQAEHRIMLNRAEAERAYGMLELAGGVTPQPKGVNQRPPEHNVTTCNCEACYMTRATISFIPDADPSPCQCRLCQDSADKPPTPYMKMAVHDQGKINIKPTVELFLGRSRTTKSLLVPQDTFGLFDHDNNAG